MNQEKKKKKIKLMGKEITETYRGKPKFKLMGKWFYIDSKGRGHQIKKKRKKSSV